MSWLIRKDQKGFTLIELLLALAILGVVTYFIVSLTSSVRQGGKAAETSQRMEIISAKMKEYYRAQGEMPGFPLDSSNNPIENEVPVDRLNLEAKYKFDGWGQPIFYHFYNDGTDFDPKVINKVEVDNVGNMAGYLLSYGGDQDDAATLTDDDNTAESAGDDILMAINVNREAMEIALDEVRELQRRVNQFDNLFEGSEACAPADTSLTTCPPNNDSSFTPPDVPNCGTGSLDQIESDASSYNCDDADISGRGSGFITDARTFIIAYYGLSDQYREDPWGNAYEWGCADSVCSSSYVRCDKQYRKFFSSGPSGTPGAVGSIDASNVCTPGDPGDDIIP